MAKLPRVLGDEEPDILYRRRMALALRVSPQWRRVFEAMGGDFTLEEWSARSGCDMDSIEAILRICQWPVRRLGEKIAKRADAG